MSREAFKIDENGVFQEHVKVIMKLANAIWPEETLVIKAEREDDRYWLSIVDNATTVTKVFTDLAFDVRGLREAINDALDVLHEVADEQMAELRGALESLNELQANTPTAEYPAGFVEEKFKS